MPRSRTSGLRNSPPDYRVVGGVEAHRLLAGPEGRRQTRRGAALRKRNILESVFRVEAAEQQLKIGRHFGRCSEARMTLSNGGQQRGKQECLEAWALHQEGAGAAKMQVSRNGVKMVETGGEWW